MKTKVLMLSLLSWVFILPTNVVWAQDPDAVHMGVAVCAKCHSGESMGSQFEIWAHSKHRNAFTSLYSKEAWEIAERSGIELAPKDSMICLGCHAPSALTEKWRRSSDHQTAHGVQCEDCHGPGSDYVDLHSSGKMKAAFAAGLVKPSADLCMKCHIEKGSHTAVLGREPKNVRMLLSMVEHPMPDSWQKDHQSSQEIQNLLARTRKPISKDTFPENSKGEYKTPLNIVIHPSEEKAYIASEASHSLIVVDLEKDKKIDEIPVGHNPSDLAIDPKGRWVFVSNRHDDNVSVVDTKSRKIIQTISVGDEPHGLLTDPSGETLYVLNTASNDISVIDVPSWKSISTLVAGRGPWSLSRSPGGKSIALTNSLSQFAPLREPFHSEITWIDLDHRQISGRTNVDGTNLMMGIDWHPSGQFALTTMNRTKTLVPLTRLLQGWTITNGLVVLWKDGKTDQILLDEPNLGFADATDLAFTLDGEHALVTSATTDRVAVVNINKMLDLLERSSAYERKDVLPNHLGTAPQIVDTYISIGRSPRGIAMGKHGQKAYVVNALDDTLSILNLQEMTLEKTIRLGETTEITKRRRGEQLFHSADITFHRQFSCHSCHPDGHVDGLTYDIEPDGIGFNPVDNRTLRGILDTAPFKWTGKNPNLSRQCGPRLAVFFTRISPFTPDELSALDYYITTISRPPNRYHPPGSEYTDAQRRGKIIFGREQTNDGRLIPATGRCVHCHKPPYFTDRKKHDVGTQAPLDTHSIFDTPHLNNIYDSAPYLHNGMAATLEEIWTVYNPEDRHGVTNDLTKDQLNDLMEYLKTL